jgi:hypothetical protein
LNIGENHFNYTRDQDSITAEAALDGTYLLRTSVDAAGLASPEVVSSDKALANVERAFRRPAAADRRHRRQTPPTAPCR